MVSNLVVEIAIYNFDLFHSALKEHIRSHEKQGASAPSCKCTQPVSQSMSRRAFRFDLEEKSYQNKS